MNKNLKHESIKKVYVLFMLAFDLLTLSAEMLNVVIFAGFVRGLL